jgi:hypothetical protein
MTPDPDHFSSLDPFRRYVPLAVWTITALLVIVIPLKIIGLDYLPGDDALRHAAKAVSGKSWSEILVLSPVYQMDHEFGWNWLLAKIHGWENWNAEALVVFSVVTLFVLVNLAALLWLKRPEAWLITLLASMILAVVPGRLMLGRPYLVTVAALLTVLFLWRTQRNAPPQKPALALLVALAALCTFIHGAWYLWALPVAAFFLAGEFRWGLALGICWGIGTVIGAALTGHPVEYLAQALQLAFLAVGAHETQRTMAGELQPFNGDYLALSAMGGLLILRKLANLPCFALVRDPAFWLVVICWILGFKVGRFWEDWGWPAFMVLMAWDLQQLLEKRLPPDSFKRIGLVCVLALATYLGVTCDYNSRWTQATSQQYLLADDPNLQGWMPDKGGILYSVDMPLFYQTFFKNPNGDWRYMLGFEPTWMPREDFEIYHKIVWNYNSGEAYKPWVDKMTPADRLVVRSSGNGPPGIAGLEWKYGAGGYWIGRLPRTNAVPSPSSTK